MLLGYFALSSRKKNERQYSGEVFKMQLSTIKVCENTAFVDMFMSAILLSTVT